MEHLDKFSENHLVVPITDNEKPNIICCVCYRFLENPYEHQECGLLVCGNCTQKIKDGDDKRCPQCKGSIFQSYKTTSHKLRIYNTKVKCCYPECKTTFDIGNIDKHVNNECMYYPKKCTDCDDMITGIMKNEHSEKCIGRLIVCTFCSKRIRFYDQDTHYDVCPDVEVECTIKGCGCWIKRKLLDEHLKNCDYSLVKCSFGCGWAVYRKDYKNKITEHETTCWLRIIKCEKCNSRMYFKDSNYHNNYQCAERMMKCGKCEMSFVAKTKLDHDNICAENEVQCFNKCGLIIKNKLMKEHMESTCKFKTRQCKLCKLYVLDSDTMHESTVCDEYDVKCKCGITTTRKLLKTHICPNQYVKCPYAKWSGCTDMIMQKDVENHIKDLDKHIKSSEALVNRMGQLIESIRHKTVEYPADDLVLLEIGNGVVPAVLIKKKDIDLDLEEFYDDVQREPCNIILNSRLKARRNSYM